VNNDTIHLPLKEINNPARVVDYSSAGKNVYLKDLNFDHQGNPICLYLTSNGHAPGPENAPYEFRIMHWDGSRWNTSTVSEADHNYDMGSLFIEKYEWLVIAPVLPGPEAYATGGEIVIYYSTDSGKSWAEKKQVTHHSIFNNSYIRRPINAKDPFYYFWADGHPHKFSKSRLFFGNSSGEVWRLPYDMHAELEQPLKIKLD
jgi:hypothetical protein